MKKWSQVVFSDSRWQMKKRSQQSIEGIDNEKSESIVNKSNKKYKASISNHYRLGVIDQVLFMDSFLNVVLLNTGICTNKVFLAKKRSE